MQQITDTILIVRPVNFRMNEQTTVNNYYQKVLENVTLETVQRQALNEFDGFADKLRDAGINVIADGSCLLVVLGVAIYPMFAENRRLERREDVLELVEKEGFVIHNIVDYTVAEDEGVFLEGTGSLILDRKNAIAYCALSPRADEELFIEFCEDFEFIPVLFTAYQTIGGQRMPIYHTNVMMCVGETFAVICLDSIDDKSERKNVLKHLKETGKELIAISEEQVNHFAGNMLQLKNGEDKRFVIMSKAARESLTAQQVKTLERHGKLLYSSLDTIEACGGGSARCMMAEIFLPKN